MHKKITTAILTGTTLMLFASPLCANSFSAYKEAIFAKVVNVSANDVLNIRSKPDYKSNKTGEAYPEDILGVDVCQTENSSTWCKVLILANVEYVEAGWVNARFLDVEGKHANRGYINIKGQSKRCYYSIRCENKVGVFMCLVGNTHFETDKPVTKWIARDILQASTSFDSAPEQSEGYCINGRMIDDYFDENL